MPYSSRHAGTLADLLMRQGEIEASKAQNRGDLLAGVVRGVAGIPAGMRQRKMAESEAQERAYDRKMSRANIASQIVERESQTAARERTGREHDDARALALKTQKVSEWLGDIASVEDLDVQRAAYRSGRSQLIEAGILTPEDAPEFYPGQSWVKARATQLLPISERFKAMFPEPNLHNVPAGTTVIDQNNPGAGPVFTAPKPPDAPPNPTVASLAAAAARGDKGAVEALRILRDQNIGSGGSPYFIPLQTGQGVVSFDTRTGGLAGRVADLKPGETAQREIANATTTGAILKQVIRSLDPAKVGPAIGRYKTAQAMLTGGDPQFAAFSAAVSTLQNTVIQLRTGAQMSEHEAARILNEISNVNLPPDTFIAKAKQAETYFDEWLRNRASVAYGRTTIADVDRMVAPADATEFDWDPAKGQLVPRGAR